MTSRRYELRSRSKVNVQNSRFVKEWPVDLKDYIRDCPLGEGSFAVVYKCHVRNTKKQAAMKIIRLNDEVFKDEKWIKMCKDEVTALQALDHPNILKCYASMEDEEPNTRSPRLTLILEYVNGANLEDYISRTYIHSKLRIPEGQIWWLFAQIASAMAHVHDRRILHRDLKPANVLLDTPSMLPKVCDFGLCRLFSANTVVAVTANVGTPYYLSPERLNRSGYNFKSDIWSLGCILYEMSCGGSPFVGERNNEYALNQRIHDGDYPPLPEACGRTDQLKVLMDLCLNVRFEERPTAQQVARYAQKMNGFFNTFKSPFA